MLDSHVYHKRVVTWTASCMRRVELCLVLKKVEAIPERDNLNLKRAQGIMT